MPNLQVKNIPAPLHRKLQTQARRQGRTLRDLVLDAVTREAEREDFRARLLSRRPVDLGRPAAASLAEIRGARNRDHGP
jgi:plasmid stability protein